MGETDDATTYDEERIFTHLRFYLDTPTNARKNDMRVTTKHEAAIEKRYVGPLELASQSLILRPYSFTAIGALIAENGGRVTDLGDPKLTHVILDKRDDSRRRELMQRTSQ